MYRGVYNNGDIPSVLSFYIHSWFVHIIYAVK